MYKTAGTPRKVSARAGRPAKPIVQQPEDFRSYQQRRYDEQLRRNFKCGFYLGLLIGLVILALVIWLWAIPTVDGCVEQVKQMAVVA